MRQTVVGMFDRYADAQKAAQALRDEGIEAEVHGSDEPATTTDAGTTGATRDDDGGFFAGIRHFFADLFGGGEHDDLHAYSEAVRRGGGIVKAEVDDDDDDSLDRARDTLQRLGAADVDERTSTWRNEGWRAGGSADGLVSEGGTTSTLSGDRIDGPLETPTMGLGAGSTERLPDDMRDSERIGSEPTTASGLGAAGRESSADLAGGSARTERLERAEGEEVIPVVREELQVGKRQVQAGGVRVYARTVTEPVHESVQLREERARVERRPVDRPASAADLDALKDRSIEVTEMAERPVVQKTAHVVEEVLVGKEARERTANIDDEVRRTEVEVQPLAANESRMRVADEVDADFRGDQGARYADGQSSEYDEPAYRFGDSLRTDPRYQGRQWDEVEGDLQRDWTQQHPDTPWERAKATARHAWERVRNG